MSEGRQERRFSRAYKVGVLSRMAAGETVSALSVELGIPRKYLYQWRERFRLGGEAALRSRGRPTKADMAAMRPGPAEPGTRVGSQPPPGRRDELDLARARIAELERKIPTGGRHLTSGKHSGLKWITKSLASKTAR